VGLGIACITYKIEGMCSVCKLTLVHDNFADASDACECTGQRWPTIVFGLKTLLETGKPLKSEPAQL